MVEFAPLPQRRWSGRPTRAFPSVSGLFDAYFEPPTAAPSAPAQRRASGSAQDEAVARLERIEGQQREAVRALEAEVRAAVGAAEAVYANYAHVENFLRLAKPHGSAKQLAELIQRAGLESGPPEVSPSGRGILVDLKGPDGTAHRVDIEIGSSASEIAQGQYRAAARAKERLKGASDALEATLSALEAARRRRARSDRVEAARAEEAARLGGPLVPPQPKRREWFERFRWMRATDGTLIVAGRDAGTNDVVVKKYLKPGDRYAHADIHGAPSVVVKRSEGEGEVSQAALGEACAFAAMMSRAWASGSGDASAFWVTPEQVSKTPESGESLGRGAFVVRGKRNTVRHLALQAAVGGLTVHGERKAMCGPAEAVAAHCDTAFLIEPGTRKATDVAKELAAKIRVHPDEIARALPPGAVDVRGPLKAAAPREAAGEEE
jgi:predicted ribosome quality control (RQC) complex YloA/Tae2 family protein